MNKELLNNKKNILILVSLLLLLILVIIYLLTGSNDAIKFKKEYESLNGTKTIDKSHTMRTVNIDDNNPIIYKTEDEIVEMISNKETFVVYFGFPNCPWCRSVLPNLLEASRDLNLDKIYYVNVLEIRDRIELKDGELTTTEKGTKGYKKLLKLLDNVLSDYNIKDDNGEDISTGEKRIYAPNVVAIVNGKPEKMTEGISEDQTDAYMKLTKKMNKESYNLFKCVIECVTENKICKNDKKC